MKIDVTMRCPFCGKEHSVEVKLADYEKYESGELAQAAFPYLSATEREQIISGICPTCQDNIFGGEEEE